MIHLDNDWDNIIRDEVAKDYYLQLRDFLRSEYATKTVYPPMQQIFQALRVVSYSQVRVVILGQDPYINRGEAHGMAFSVNYGVKVPPSLKNIYKELACDVGIAIPNHGHLMEWAKQGVLLLNSCLTVREGQSKSHSGHGWEKFVTFVISALNQRQESIVFMLWGNDAKSKADLIDDPKHLVLKAAHPSPLAGGAFFGCKHFSRANAFLKGNGQKEIDWRLTSV